MIKNKTDLLDPTAESRLDEKEQKIVEEAPKTGVGSRASESLTDETVSPGGVVGQTVDTQALEEIGRTGGESDLTGGRANQDEATGAAVGQNKYNR